VTIVKAKRRGRYIGANERKCDGEECENFVPQGWYKNRPAYLSCSAECWHRRFFRGNLLLKCDCGCGKDFRRRCKRKTVTNLVFFSWKHRGDYLRNKYLTENCGVFRGVLEEYTQDLLPYTIAT
jgi:hypothetical protein